MAKTLFLFFDGIGVGADDVKRNPFAFKRSAIMPFYETADFSKLPFDGVLKPTFADMGVPGLPQSGTGQTALFTGVNSAKIVGRHISGIPSPSLRPIIDEHSIFLKLKRMGKTGTFANALSEAYFERRGERIAATARAQKAGGFSPRMVEDLKQERAVTHDLTNRFMGRLGIDAPRFTVERSAEILVEILQKVDFCLFEYILTDVFGHAQDFEGSCEIIEILDRFLNRLLARADLRASTILLSSDHGNLEDLSTKTHTTNPLPTCIWGANKEKIVAAVSRIEDITPAILANIA